jgi:hypothetical protein
MIRRPRDTSADGTSREAMDAAVGRGMADVLAVLDDVIDDDAALGHIYAGLGENVPCSARASEPEASRRRLALRSGAGVAAALAAGAVAVAAIGFPGARHNGVDTTAYVVKRVDSALSAAHPGAIAQMTVTTRSGAISGGRTMTTTAEEWSYGDRWRAVTYSAAGQPLYDEDFGTASVYTVVSYQARTWARQNQPGHSAARASGPRGCGRVVAALPLLFQPGLPAGGPSASSLPVTVARDLRAAVSCGTLAEAGRQRVDGIDAIELTSRPDSPISETIWVSPRTYLPVRVVTGPGPGEPGPRQTAEITWLAPTAQNLARLTVPIPAGFRQVPFAEAVRSTSQHAPVWAKA